MDCFTVGVLIVVGGVVAGIVAGVYEAKRKLALPPDKLATETWGPINSAMSCPHCQTKGCVRTKVVERKKGISGSKAAGALLTGGLSILATGLSRKEHPTQAHCDECANTWEF
ncbi:MAG: hypothetical protein SH850_24895 [Planctomycetaceae bacterium]|nr:hypothetical protein [Planctomycetaceae bacterium]